MKILLADDKQEVRSALKLLLEHDKGVWAVEGEASNYGEILDEMSSACFDVILLDWELPGFRVNKQSERTGSGIVLLGQLQSLQPGVKVIAMSGRSEARSEALAAGVKCFVSKGDPAEALLDTLKLLNGAKTES
jgi:DNA-binding NarL/FixJ family response regulator